jgi:hypothetical protein
VLNANETKLESDSTQIRDFSYLYRQRITLMDDKERLIKFTASSQEVKELNPL